MNTITTNLGRMNLNSIGSEEPLKKRKIKVIPNNKYYKLLLLKYNIGDTDFNNERDVLLEKVSTENIEYHIAKSVQYKRHICWDIKNEMYCNLDKPYKKKLRIICRELDENINLFCETSVPIDTKILRVNNLKKSMINFLDEIDNIDDISGGIKKMMGEI